MDAGAINRITLAGIVTAASLAIVAALVLATGPAAEAGGGEQLLPDLIIEPIERVVVVDEDERKLLRLSHTASNVGAGPLEISPDLDTTECTDGGDRGRDADQIIHLAGGGTQADPVGCMIFHEPHNHYHFKDFAQYDLYRDRGGRKARHVATSDKVSFCVFDLRATHPGLPGTPDEPVYTSANCDEDDGTHGISVGWADTYDENTQGQELDVTGQRPGRYCLVAQADPGDRIAEIDDTAADNRRQLRIGLRPGKNLVRALEEPCKLR